MGVVKFENIESKITEVRGQKVILDSDVAELYGIETKRINEAVKNNLDKFPVGYIIELNRAEWDSLKSKFSTSIKGGKVKLPSAFTEKGLYMLATIADLCIIIIHRTINPTDAINSKSATSSNMVVIGIEILEASSFLRDSILESSQAKILKLKKPYNKAFYGDTL